MKHQVLFSLKNNEKVFKTSAAFVIGSLRVNCKLVEFEEWMDDLQFYILFNTVTVISGRWDNDYERLCAMELRLRLGRFCHEPRWNSVR